MKAHLMCGSDILEGYENVDIVDFGQGIQANIEEGFPFPDCSLEEIFIKNGLEHIRGLEFFFKECVRTLKRGGKLRIWVPHYKSPDAYRIQHKSYFAWQTFTKYPAEYDLTKRLKLISCKIWVDANPNKIAKLISKPFNWLANISPKWWEKLFYVTVITVEYKKV